MTAVLGPKPTGRTHARRWTSSTGSSPATARCWSSTTRRTTPTTRTASGTRSSGAFTTSVPGGRGSAARLLGHTALQQGRALPWTVCDYPLTQAIIDGIVKRPIKGVAEGIHEVTSDIASNKYRAYLTAGVERWREYREQLAPLGRTPAAVHHAEKHRGRRRGGRFPAHEVSGGVRHRQDCWLFTQKQSGEITKKDVEEARKVAREVDAAASPINASSAC